MARRLIGLDIGTNAVRVAELDPGSPPRVTSFGQVALPFDAMRDGEVADPAAVTSAIERLWRELSLRRGEVRVGIASPRVIVRVIEMPAMPEADLAGALRFQAQDLIPIPLEEAVLSFQVLGAGPERAVPGLPEPPPGAPPGEAPTEPVETAEPQAMTRVLLAAAHRDAVETLVGAVRAAGLRVAAVDLVPLALVRALARGDAIADGTEAIVSVGGGVSVIVVHNGGLPQFVRILGVGGRALTDAVARDLELPIDQAESLKRQGDVAPEDLWSRARAAMERPLGDLAEQIRSSLDYYRTQPGADPLTQVTLTGGGALTPGLDDALRRLVDVPIQHARPRDVIAIGDIGFPADQLPSLDPYLPVPVGLALGGLATGRRINLLGAETTRVIDVRRALPVAAAVGGVLLLALGLVTWQRASTRSDKQDAQKKEEARTAQLQSEVAKLADAQRTQTEVDSIRTQITGVLASDVSWARMLQELARTVPNDVWLTSFQGSTTNASSTGGAPGGAATTTTVPGSTSSTTSTTSASGASTSSTTVSPGAGALAGGTVTFAANGLDFTSVSAWIQRISAIPSFRDLWVSSATRGAATNAGRTIVTFSSNAAVTSAAHSDRLSRFEEDR